MLRGEQLKAWAHQLAGQLVSAGSTRDLLAAAIASAYLDGAIASLRDETDRHYTELTVKIERAHRG